MDQGVNEDTEWSCLHVLNAIKPSKEAGITSDAAPGESLPVRPTKHKRLSCATAAVTIEIRHGFSQSATRF